MDKNIPDDKLLKYLDNEMDTSERQKFEALLEEDPSLKVQMENLITARTVVNYYGLFKKISNVRQQLQLSETPKINKQRARVLTMRKVIKISFAAAACIILILVGVVSYTIYNLTPDKVFNESYVPYSVANTRSDKNKAGTIEQAYASNDLNKVIQLNSPLVTDEEKLLVGMAALKRNNLNLAIDQFKKLLAEPGNSFRQDAEYYLGLSYVKAKNYDGALTLLIKIHNDKGHLYNAQVPSKVLRDVKWLKWK